jgi:predicted phosphodiesterase
MSPTPRVVVLGDLHLTTTSPPVLGRDLARLLRRHAGQQIIVLGDFFDFVTEVPTHGRRRAVGTVLEAHPDARRALGTFLDQGGSLLFADGNHDAGMGHGELRAAMTEALTLSSEARQRLTATPWFWREGAVHLEHGHFYDPDNAPADPLVLGQPSLGVRFATEFINPTQAHRYLQANDATPLELLVKAFAWYGPRGPYVIYRYFYTAFRALARSGPFYRAAAERDIGDGKRGHFAEEAGVPRALVDDVLHIGAHPTLASWSATFARLYMDRVLATLLCTAGPLAMVGGRRAAGATATTLGALLMVTSWLRGHDRYGGAVVDRLGAAASRIADETGADLVVFGHTHREALEDRYANTGSFAFPRDAPGRPYLELELSAERPSALRRYLRPT